MARQSSNGATGAIAGLVIFAFLWVITLVLAILFYTKYDAEYQVRNEDAKTLAKYVNKQDQGDTDVQALVGRDGSKTVVRQMIERRNAYRKQLTGEDSKSLEEIQSMIEQLNADASVAGFGDNAVAVGAVSFSRSLLQNFQAERDKLANAEVRIQELNRLNLEMEQSKAANARTFDEAADELKGQVSQLDNANRQAQQYGQQQQQQLVDHLEQVRSESEAQLLRLTAENKQLETRVAQLQQTLDLQGDGARSFSPQAWREPDGHITKVSDNGEYVFISLGYKSRIRPGMTFEVFDPKVGVEADENSVLRGVATIEITNVSETSSTGRVVRVTGRDTVLQESDLIASVAYDPNRVYQFHIFGDFDIDKTGQANAQDRDRVKAMVLDHGGELIEAFTYQADFLVLGVEPPLPRPLNEQDQGYDPVKIAQHAAAVKEYEHYQMLIKKAVELRVPVLNQNRFLSLIGYYHR